MDICFLKANDMLHAISWEDYWVALLIALGCYYAVLTIHCYRAQLLNWWRKQQHKP